MNGGPSIFLDPTMVVFFKMLLAMVLGGILGTERSVIAHQPAGTRTFGLVALAAALLIAIANYVQTTYAGFVNFDPLHVTSAIVTGIGFIGGGLIIFRGDTIHGTTTAAGLWVAAAVGIAVGYGLYAIALFATALAMLMFTGMWFIEDRFKHWFSASPPSSTSS